MPGFTQIPNDEVFDDPLWTADKFTKGQALIDLYRLAQFKAGIIHKRGITIQLKPGQVGWSRSKVRRYISMLENDTMVDRKSTHSWTHLTICNYDTYQDVRPSDSTTHGTSNSTTHGTTHGTQLKKEKKVKKVKNGKKKKQVAAIASTLLTIFGDQYLEYTGVEYHASFGKDGKILKDLEDQYGTQPVEAGIIYFFQEYIVKDSFASKNPNVGMLRSTWNGMVAMATEKSRKKREYDNWANDDE